MDMKTTGTGTQKKCLLCFIEQEEVVSDFTIPNAPELKNLFEGDTCFTGTADGNIGIKIYKWGEKDSVVSGVSDSGGDFKIDAPVPLKTDECYYAAVIKGEIKIDSKAVKVCKLN